MDYKLPKVDQNKINVLKVEALKEIYSYQPFVQFIKENNLSEQLVNDNISKFLKVLEDVRLCKDCHGVDACKKKMGKYQLELIYDSYQDKIENSVVPCKYESLRSRIKKDYIYSEFNEKYLDYDLQEIGKYFAASRMELVKSFVSLYSDLKEGKSTKAIYLYGDPKVGKTFIMTIFSKYVSQLKLGKIAFIDCVSRVDLLNNALYKEKDFFASQFEVLKTVPFLFLDDFGNEYKNDYIRDSIIYPLITYRANNGLMTFYTSSFSLDEIKEMYTFNKASLIKTKRLVDTIKDNSTIFELRGMKFPN